MISDGIFTTVGASEKEIICKLFDMIGYIDLEKSPFLLLRESNSDQNSLGFSTKEKHLTLLHSD